MAKEKKERKERVVRSIDERIAEAVEKRDKYKRLLEKEEEIIAALQFKKENPDVGRGGSVKLNTETMMFLQKEGITDINEYINQLITHNRNSNI